MSQPVKVLLTGAAGQIAYSLVGMIGRGDLFGPKQEVILNLLDLTPMLTSLGGLKMELDDCAFPLLKDVLITDKPEVAFDQIDVALMIGSMPRKEGMERKHLLDSNVGIFKDQGHYLDKYAKKSVKVIVVGNPANTNALAMMTNAPSIPKENFSAMTRLDHNRAQTCIAHRLHIRCDAVKNCIIWGNHSSTQFVDVSKAVALIGNQEVSVNDAIKDEEWIRRDFLQTIQTRGSAVIAARKLSSSMSAAKAIVDHVHDWWFGTKPGEWTSMAVYSDGLYGAPVGVFFSYPVKIENKKWSVVQGLALDDWSREKFNLNCQELKEEAHMAGLA